MPLAPMPPVYKGVKAPLFFTRKRVWQRGRGWTSAIQYQGEAAKVANQIPSLLGYCTQVEFEEDGSPYSSLLGTWSGFDEATHDQDLETIWELHQQVVELDALATPTAEDAEEDFPGFKQRVRLAIADFKKQSADKIVPVPFRSKWIDATRIPNGAGGRPGSSIRDLAEDYFDDITGGADHFRAYQPIVQRNLTVSEVYSTYGASPTSPIIYESTATFAAVIGVPAIVVAALPTAGQWLETPPQVQQTALSKFVITQTWEWAERIDPLYYPNRFTPP